MRLGGTETFIYSLPQAVENTVVECKNQTIGRNSVKSCYLDVTCGHWTYECKTAVVICTRMGKKSSYSTFSTQYTCMNLEGVHETSFLVEDLLTLHNF